MKRALVIGCGGQIGSDLCPYLVHHEGWDVTLADRLGPAKVAGASALAAGFGSHSWREGWRLVDATSEEPMRALLRATRPDVIFPLAAYLSARGEKEPKECWALNVGSLELLFELILEMGDGYRPVVVWPSSIAAYGVPVDGLTSDLVPEDYPLRPVTMYGATKVAGELLGQYYAKEALIPGMRRGTIDFRSLRFPGLLNATAPGGGSSDYANMMYFQAAGKGERRPIFVSRETRMPFMHMDDAIRALVTLAKADEATLHRRVYNVRAFAPTVDEFVTSIGRFRPGFDVTCDPDFRQAIVRSWPRDMDDRAARTEWGFSTELDLDRTTAAVLAAIAA